MLKTTVRKTKNLFAKTKETLKTIGFALALAINTMPVTAFASNAYLNPLNNLKTIFISIVATAGVIVLGFGAVTFGIAFSKRDQNGEHDAINKVIAGGIMTGISAILAALSA